MYKSIAASILFAAVSAGETEEWSRSVNNCAAWTGDLSSDAAGAYGYFADVLYYVQKDGDYTLDIMKSVSKTLIYLTKAHKDIGMISSNCFGSEWSKCVQYQGRAGAQLFSIWYDVVKMISYCETEANGGDGASCSEYVMYTVFDTSSTLWYSLQMVEYCFADDMAEEEVEEVAEAEGEDEMEDYDEEY